ncbi:MAG: hypothetical protein ACI8Q2_000479, partial [Candidatus Omnitrophota bacterium]
ENEARPTNTKAKAKEQALEFLRTTYDFDESQYKQTRDLKTSLDNRDDFSFAWQHKDVNIPWSDTDDSKSKLITKITLAGNTIVAYSKSVFYTPDSFRRFISLQRNTGNNFSSIVRIFDTILLAAAVFFVVIRRNHLVMHTAKRFYIGTMAFILGLMIISYINQYELVLHNYDTSVPFSSYLMRSCINYLLAAIVFAVYIIMPSLSGESICHENNKTRTSDGLLHNLRSTFLSRNVSQRILVGYFAFFIMLGLQALITAIGQKYWNVWVEHSWMEDSSTAYLPFIAAFIVGFKASVSEELLYRLFTINWIKKISGSLIVAVLISSLIWGFAHSHYAVFPSWFRGVEVSILGVFLAIIYLRFGLISVLVAHYVFDVFWSSAAYLFGTSSTFNFVSCLIVLLLPFIFAVITWFTNKKELCKTMQWKLNKHQQYNQEVLTHYLNDHWDKYASMAHNDFIKEITNHGWDMAVVEEAVKHLKKQQH